MGGLSGPPTGVSRPYPLGKPLTVHTTTPRRSMLRILALALVGLQAFAAAACGGGESEGQAMGGETTGTTESSIRVALVTDIGGLNDRGFNALANQGLERAESELPVLLHHEDGMLPGAFQRKTLARGDT